MVLYTHNIKKIKGTTYLQTDTLTVRVNKPLHVMTHSDCRRWTRVRTQTRILVLYINRELGSESDGLFRQSLNWNGNRNGKGN